MKTALFDLFTSKKFLAAGTAIAVYLAGRFGFDLDTAVLDRIYAALLVYVGAQGIADNGKSAAAITAAAAIARPAIDAGTSGRSAGAGAGPVSVAGAAGVAVLVLALGGLSMTTACGPKSTFIGQLAWDCTAPERAEVVTVLTPVVESVIAAAASADGSKINLAPLREATSKANLLSDAGVVLSCAMATAFAALEQPDKPQTGTLVSLAGRPVDPAALRSAFDELRAAEFPGATFKTVSGTI